MNKSIVSFTVICLSLPKAWVQMVEREREQEEKERQKEHEERKKKAQEMKWRKRMLEAAFDGDVDEINSVLSEVNKQYSQILRMKMRLRESLQSRELG
jgi:hypothetical protein